jgi:hypothetical protein
MKVALCTRAALPIVGGNRCCEARAMDQQTVTLVAAGVAATASLSNVIVNVYFARRMSRESQFRDLLKPNMVVLGETLHAVVACSRIVGTRAQQGIDIRSWLKKAHDACNQLKQLHRQVKYPLWGVSEGIRELTRLANWVAHTREDTSLNKSILDAADDLRLTLDEVIKDVFLTGRPPSRQAKRRVSDNTRALRALWLGSIDEPEEIVNDGAPNAGPS